MEEAQAMMKKHMRVDFLKKHYALVPLFGALGFGCILAGGYTLRLATLNPDVSWRRKTNPEPWQHQVDQEGKAVRYKFWQGGADHHAGQTKYGIPAHPAERPPIEKWWAEHLHAEKASASAHAH